MADIRGRYVLQKSGNREYVLPLLEHAMSLLDLDSLGVLAIEFAYDDQLRGRWDQRKRIVWLNPYAKCFHADYRGYAYKKFGGQKDLTPGGVFLHECGHCLTFKHRAIIRDFRELRSHHPKSVSAYGTKRIYEDIAESFRLFVSNPSLLEKEWPMRYEVLNKWAGRYICPKPD